jgi:5'-3' exonuclease
MENYMTSSWNDLAELEQEKLEEKNLLLIDANNLAFRYLHRPNFDNFSQEYIRTISSLAKSYSAVRTICNFDVGASTYRKTIYPGYKQNRKEIQRTEEEQIRFTGFFNCLKDTTDILPFEHYKFKGIEADDIITFLTLNLKEHYDNVWIVSSDRDLYQLLDENVHIFNLFSRKEITLDSLYEESELTPEEFLFSRFIEGDKSDGIVGIEGIGKKRSQALVKEYKTLDNLIQALPIKGKSKYIQNLNSGKEILLLNKQLMDLTSHINEAITMSENPEVVREVLSTALSKTKV